MGKQDGYLVGLDAGGGGGRAVLLRLADGRQWSAYRSWQHRPVAGTAGLGFDLDTELVIEGLGDACREALERADARADEVVGISATSMREGMVLVSGDRVLFATPNRDARALAEGLGLAESHGERLYGTSGRWPLPVFPAARLLWLKNNRPELLDRADTLLSISDWILWRLSGERMSEPSQAAESLLFDIKTGAWDEELIGELGLPRRLFPETVAAGRAVGRIREDAAALFGLSPATPVAMGGADSQSGLLGCGLTAAGQAGAITGTTSPVQLLSDRPCLDKERRTWTGNHLLPGLWAVESNAGFAGETLEWLARMLRPGHSRPAAWLLAEAGRGRAGAAGMLSTLGAEVMNAREPRMPLGHMSLSHLTTAADPEAGAHFARALVEGMAFALRANLEQTAAVAAGGQDPLLPERLHLSGGMSRSRVWRQTLADVLGLAVAAEPTAEASPRGAAICAAVGAGLYGDLAEAARDLVARPVLHEPEAEASAVLAERYQAWLRLKHSQQGADREAGAVLGAELFSETGQEEAGAEPPRPRILVTAQLDQSAVADLQGIGELEYANYRETKEVLTGERLIERLDGVEVFVTETELVGVDTLARLPDLRVVASCRSDAVNVDVEAATAFGIPVLNAPGRNAHAVADLTVVFALILVRKVRQADAFIHEPGARAGDMARFGRAYSQLVGRELGGMTVGLAGLGAVGREVARRLRAFGARVLAYDPYLAAETADLEDAELVSLDELLASSDIVSLHLPVSQETEGIVGAAELGRMKEGAFLINTARAALVDEQALEGALSAGHLAGAALDVFSVEPPGADHPLLGHPNVVATPHIGGNTQDVGGHQGRIIAEDLGRLLAGRRPDCALNPETAVAFSWNGPRREPGKQELERLGKGPGPALTDLERDGRGGRAAGSDSRLPVSGQGEQVMNGQLRDNMERLLEDFTGRIAADPGMAGAAARIEVAMHFELHDLDLDFHFSLADGGVSAAMGRPEAVDVELAMRAEIFDGMMRRTVNGMDAAGQGELSFTGDVTRAMSLQELSGDLERLYNDALVENGEPGDLTVTRAAAASSAAEGAVPAASGRGGELIAVVDELYSTGLITATGGNVSTRREPGSEELLMTPSAMFKGELSPDLLVRVDLEGRPLDKGSRAPSSERLMHTAIYNSKPEAEAVIHCHAPNATVLANTELPFLPISTEAAFFADIPRVPFIMPGTAELADAVAAAMAEGWAVLMKNHGLLVAGRSLRRAADMAGIIERSAEIMLGCWAVGKEPPVLPEEVVAKLRATGELIA